MIMKRLILLLLLIPSLLFAGNLQQKHQSVIARLNVTSGGACDTYSTDQAQTTQDSLNANANWIYGQSFQCTAGTLGAIRAYVRNVPASPVSGNFVLRIGTGADLTSSYLEEITISPTIPGETDQEITFVSATNPSLSGSTTYYFGINSEDGVSFYRRLADVYANGSYYSNSTGTVDWSMVPNTGRELWFEVDLCD
jgi:hypothetical protein